MSRVFLAVFVGLAALEIALLAFVDTTTVPLDRVGRPFQLRGISSGTVMTQRLEASANGLEQIRLAGAIAPGARAAVLDAQLIELSTEGTAMRVVRAATLELPPAATACCLVRFEPVVDSRWRMYRLDVTVGELHGRDLSLWASAGPVNGRLTVNGRPQSALLIFTTKAAAGSGFGRLRATSARTAVALVALALMYNAAVATMLSMLTIASDLRRV